MTGAEMRAAVEVERDHLTALMARYDADLGVTVPPEGDLQAALDHGGVIHLMSGAVYRGAYTVWVPGTRLLGHGASVVSQRAAAFVAPPGSYDLAIRELSAVSQNFDQAVVRLGANDETQTSTELEPHHITLDRVRVPTHRGKRGIEVNARAVELTDCSVLDTWDPAGRDSQGLCVLNSSGALLVTGGTYEAGSENIMVGGDTMKMAGVITRDLLFDGVVLRKPLSWRTDGVPRKIKNLLELKAGVGVRIRNFHMTGTWVDGQVGHAIVLTPRDGRLVDDVTIEDGIITDVGDGFQIMGRDYLSHTQGSMRVRVNRVAIRTRADFMGHGRYALISGEPASVVFDDCRGDLSGQSLVLAYQGDVMEADGSVRPGGPIGELRMGAYDGTRPEWGFMLWGHANGGVHGQGLEAANILDVRANTFRGDSDDTVSRRNFPANVYLPASAA